MFCALLLFVAYVVIIGYQFCLYVRWLGKSLDNRDVKYGISLSSEESINSNQVLCCCTVLVVGKELFVDLVVLDMPDYDMILEMN